MCANERHLLDHIELASILTTQLGSESEAILLRERVLRDAVAKQDELIHPQTKKGRNSFLTAGASIYLLVVVWQWTRGRGRFPRLPPSSGPTLHLSSGDIGVCVANQSHMPSRALRMAEEDRLSVSLAGI
jgi:hypothetical protein